MKRQCGHKASEKHELAGKKEADKDDLVKPLITPVQRMIGEMISNIYLMHFLVRFNINDVV